VIESRSLTSSVASDLTAKPPPTLLERIADGDRIAVDECSRVHGPLIWTWARKFTDSTGDAETATHAILADILDGAKNYDAAQCSELTFIKQVCIRHLLG